MDHFMRFGSYLALSSASVLGLLSIVGVEEPITARAASSALVGLLTFAFCAFARRRLAHR